MPLFSNRYFVKLHCFGGLFWLDFVQVFQLLCRDFLSLFEAILAPCYWLVLCPTSWTLASLFYTTLEALSLVLSCWKLRHFSGFIYCLFWTVYSGLVISVCWLAGYCFLLQDNLKQLAHNLLDIVCSFEQCSIKSCKHSL